MIQKFYSWVYIRTKHSFREIHAPLCSLEHYSQQPRHGNNLNDHWQTNRLGCDIYTIEYYSAIEHAIRRNMMKIKTLILSEVSQKEKDKCLIILFIAGIKDLAQMNLFTRKKQTHGHGEHTCCCQGVGERSRMDWEFCLSRCKLLHFEWISKDILLYRKGNYV